MCEGPSGDEPDFQCAGPGCGAEAGADKLAQAAARNHPNHAGVQRWIAWLLKSLCR
jgi:hypothetical protein